MDLFQEFKSLEVLNRIPAGTLLVAVSGGADSVALLQLVKRESALRGWKPCAAHVQHGLRGRESLRDQRFVEGLARSWGLPCSVRKIPVRTHARNRRLGLEEAARTLRYRALADEARRKGARAILVAHQADDQAETFLLNLMRGAGADGLSGMPPWRPLSDVTGRKADSGLLLVRPLLDFSREDILAYLRSQRLGFRSDRSNRSLEHRRNWVRLRLLPLMRDKQPQIARKIADCARLLRQERPGRDRDLTRLRGEVLIRRGSHLDLASFFRYDINSRSRLLHRLFPRFSGRRIRATLAWLERHKFKSGSVPLSGLIRS